jgi:hypothetical protein
MPVILQCGTYAASSCGIQYLMYSELNGGSTNVRQFRIVNSGIYDIHQRVWNNSSLTWGAWSSMGCNTGFGSTSNTCATGGGMFQVTDFALLLTIQNSTLYVPWE